MHGGITGKGETSFKKTEVGNGRDYHIAPNHAVQTSTDTLVPTRDHANTEGILANVTPLC